MFYYRIKNQINSVCSSSVKLNNNQVIEITEEEYNNILLSFKREKNKNIEIIEPNQPIIVEENE